MFSKQTCKFLYFVSTKVEAFKIGKEMQINVTNKVNLLNVELECKTSDDMLWQKKMEVRNDVRNKTWFVKTE